MRPEQVNIFDFVKTTGISLKETKTKGKCMNRTEIKRRYAEIDLVPEETEDEEVITFKWTDEETMVDKMFEFIEMTKELNIWNSITVCEEGIIFRINCDKLLDW